MNLSVNNKPSCDQVTSIKDWAYKKQNAHPLAMVRFLKMLGESSALSPCHHPSTRKATNKQVAPTSVPTTWGELHALRTPPHSSASK